MAKRKPEDDRKKRTPEDRIQELKRHAEKLCGGEIEVDSLDDCSVETEEAFWKHVVDYEEARWTTNFQQLENAGVSLPAPDSLNDAELTEKLWEIIQKLSLLHVYIDQTDHLSNRELYTHLWTDSLREETKAMAPLAGSACHIQVLGGGSDEDNLLFLKHYADDDFRQSWHKDFPRDPIPQHEDPPYDRDRLLPKPDSVNPPTENPTEAELEKKAPLRTEPCW
jgi:hypothetical protein